MAAASFVNMVFLLQMAAIRAESVCVVAVYPVGLVEVVEVLKVIDRLAIIIMLFNAPTQLTFLLFSTTDFYGKPTNLAIRL